jgi:hypothetical protein
VPEFRRVNRAEQEPGPAEARGQRAQVKPPHGHGARGANGVSSVLALQGLAPMRAKMESSFGADFGHVRVHRDAEAAELSSGLFARAFTHGSVIYFGRGAYDPSSRSGQHLLAHEFRRVTSLDPGFCRHRRPKIRLRCPPAGFFSLARRQALLQHRERDFHERFGFVGDAFVACFGDAAPVTTRRIVPAGFKVVRVDMVGRRVVEFAVNRISGAASVLPHGGFERPVDCGSDPTGASTWRLG